MRRIDLDELPRWSAWPGRIIGTTPWTCPRRTIEKIDEEYDKDKYAKALEWYDRAGGDPEAIMTFEWSVVGGGEHPICVSRGDHLYATTIGAARAAYQDLLHDVLRPAIDEGTTVVELGCGYGYNLWRLSGRMKARRFIGGDYSANAIKLAARLYERNSLVSVRPFNFYDALYQLLEQLEGPCVVFTSHALEQLPTAAHVIEVLASHIDKRSNVFHFEPVIELQGQDLLSLMRRRYIQINDYNVDLMSVLQRHRELIEIVDTRPNLLGLNPLCATSVVHWKMRRE
ncbi:MAG: class I SAM-dependent methyltransferase [Planctomycetes bacterium]|nr:class I SAM-dependent methyltransferase [Planctomycetota bacterium]